MLSMIGATASSWRFTQISITDNKRSCAIERRARSFASNPNNTLQPRFLCGRLQIVKYFEQTLAYNTVNFWRRRAANQSSSTIFFAHSFE
jgi:hypothetical protein